MQSNLKLIFQIQNILQKAGYPDYKRISLEVLDLLTEKKLNKEVVFSRLEKGEPWEYIKGYAEFLGSNFIVNKHTLIPRIETEQIVDEAVRILELEKEEKIKNILDVGTGTGCIPISISKKISKSYSIIGTDISEKALKTARENEKNILKKNNIRWVRTNLINGIKLKSATLITANLPYIPTKKYEQLDKSVKKYEPRIALDGGEKGYEVYEQLFNQINGGEVNVKYLILETENSIFSATLYLTKTSLKNVKVKPIKDIYARDRFLLISFP